MSRDGVWDVHELLALLKPKFDARKLLETDAEVKRRFEALLSAIKALPGRVRSGIEQQTHLPPRMLWWCDAPMPKELKQLLKLNENAAINFYEFVYGPKTATLDA
jgi:hypothetical protein